MGKRGALRYGDSESMKQKTSTVQSWNALPTCSQERGDMSDMRQRYASTALQGLGSSPDRERAVDVVGAAGHCDSTGIDVWRTAYGLEKSAYHRLRNAVLKAFQDRYPRETEAERVVDQAIHEFCGAGCVECEGTGEVGALTLNAPRVVCPTCNGTKIRHYSDTTRALMMALSYGRTKHLAFKIGWAIKFLSTEDIRANVQINAALGRDTA